LIFLPVKGSYRRSGLSSVLFIATVLDLGACQAQVRHSIPVFNILAGSIVGKIRKDLAYLIFSFY
jgi:hypothetical protein